MSARSRARCSRPWLCAEVPRCLRMVSRRYLAAATWGLGFSDQPTRYTKRGERHAVPPTTVASSPLLRISARLGSCPLVVSPPSISPARLPASSFGGSTNRSGFIANRNHTRASLGPDRRERKKRASSSSASKKLDRPRRAKRLARSSASECRWALGADIGVPKVCPRHRQTPLNNDKAESRPDRPKPLICNVLLDAVACVRFGI